VLKKAYIEEKSNDGLPDPMAASLAWENHKKRNQSIIVELLQVDSMTIIYYSDNSRSYVPEVVTSMTSNLSHYQVGVNCMCLYMQLYSFMF
jgi:hypothetical protein